MSETKETILNTELTKDNPWKIIHLLSEELDKRFSIDEILEAWYSVHGKEKWEPEIVVELRQRLSKRINRG
jgi:hypothetical protein